MARARNIKPGFFDNEILGELPALTRLLFIGLWCLADREGRLQDRPKRIKKELLGYDDVTSDGVDAMLQQLCENGFIQRYEVDGDRYIQVTNFVKHQNPHCKEQESMIPAPGEDMGLGVAEDRVKKAHGNSCDSSQDPRTYQTGKEQENTETPCKHSASTVQAQEKHGSCRADSLIPDSLIPDSKTYMVADGQTTDDRDMGLGVAEDRVKRAHGNSCENSQDLRTCPVDEPGETDETTEDEPEGKSGRKPASPDWKTAKTPLEIGFCKFWDAFPNVRKRAKPACWRKWQVIRPDAAMLDQMLRAIEAGKRSSDWKRGYVPMPLTWLNQGRWEDVMEEAGVNEYSDSRQRSRTEGFRRDGDY